MDAMRYPGLDILRAVAIFLVIGRHLHIPDDRWKSLLIWKNGGWVGVDLFFVLSGFLISSLLFTEQLKTKQVDVKRFLIRRGFKIYPAFYLFMLITIPVKIWMDDAPNLRAFLGELLFLQNYLGTVYGHTWSLAVEEHFYIGFALITAWLVKHYKDSPFQHIPKLFVVISCVCLALRFSNLWLHPEYSDQHHLVGTHLRIDSLMFGVCLAYYWTFHDLAKRIEGISTYVLVAIGIALLSVNFIFVLEKTKWISIVGFVGNYFGAGCLLLGALRLESASNFLWKQLAEIGKASYSIYLWHIVVATWGYSIMMYLFGRNNYYMYLCCAFFGAIAFGWLMNRFIEQPIILLRNRLFPPKSELKCERANDRILEDVTETRRRFEENA